jgi:peptidoglycan/LPS O-acetylase OafA/YrhL
MEHISSVDCNPVSLKTKLKTAEPNHKPELDGIRGIALLAVMLCHIGPFIRLDTFQGKAVAYSIVPGWGGVELFFVLSGFLITGILLKTRSAENYFSAFYMRRFLRIFPIYYFVLTAGILIAMHNSWWNALLPPTKTRIAYYFYLQNWPIVWSGHVVQRWNGFGHFWSLAVEEQFYVVWPIVVWLLSEEALLWLCSVGLVLALLLRFSITHIYLGNVTFMGLTSSRIDGLFVGVILAILLRRGKIPIRWTLLFTGIGAAILGYIAIFHRHELIDTYFYMPTIGITGFALLCGGLLALSQSSIAWLNAILTMRWLRTVGKYSYGMYIYHIPIYAVFQHIMTKYYGINFPVSLHSALLSGACLIVITFLIAKVSYDIFESRFLVLKRYFRPRWSSVQSAGENIASMK